MRIQKYKYRKHEKITQKMINIKKCRLPKIIPLLFHMYCKLKSLISRKITMKGTNRIS